MRRATFAQVYAGPHTAFLSTLSFRRATRQAYSLWCRIGISIHALLAESDSAALWAVLAAAISIHALLAESDPAHSFWQCTRRDFYPRSPCGERRRYDRMWQKFWHFYPRSPCGERHMAHALANDISHISIHALLAESDAAAEYGVPIIDGFLSTLSLRRATYRCP